MDGFTADELKNTGPGDEYKTLFSRCYSAIEHAHRLHKTWVIFEIPPFVFGKPFFDQQRCLDLICDSLESKKFNYKVMFNHPPHVQVFISWAKAKSRGKEETKGRPIKPAIHNSTQPYAPETREPPKEVKRVAFSADALLNLEQTYNAMRSSGKLNHLKSFQSKSK